MADPAPIPYVTAYGNITKVLQKIKTAETPARFTQDHLANTLNMPGGGAKPVIPFLKRIGFLASDGTPTDLYKRFRGTKRESGAAAAQALRTGYRPLYAVNETLHAANDEELRGVVIQITGADESSTTVRSVVGSFKALREFADFRVKADEPAKEEDEAADEPGAGRVDEPGDGLGPRIKLGYTINLHLPATSDVAVFNAIFKSLREHLL